jgi:Fuc2NAc and GlcNAc transferase
MTWSLTAVMCRYTRQHGMLDIPNARSAHTIPTPRGGGVALAIGLFTSITLGVILERLSRDLFTALFFGGAVVAGVGWLDDRQNVDARLRGSVHLLAAAWAIYWLGGMSGLDLGCQIVPLGWTGSLLAVLAIAWLINLYNFMDGTDGLAATQAILTGAAGAMLVGWPPGSGVALASINTVFVGAGFLLWNWPPAKIFMGDVGSGLLGYWFGVLAVAGERLAQVPSLSWLILLAPFIADASYTLVWRIMRGEVWYAAHRTHAYQQLLLLGFNHRRILLSFVALNVCICWPLAGLATVWPQGLPILLAGLYTGLWLVWRTVQRYAGSA